MNISKVVEKEISKIIDELKSTTPVDTGAARDGWKYVDGKIVNEVEYIDQLDAGSSTQAPRYFIERTLLSHKGVRPNGSIVTTN